MNPNKGDYTVDDLINEPSFQAYAYRKDPENIRLWNTWLQRHPEKAPSVEEALFILREFYSIAHPLTEKEYEEELLQVKKRLSLSKSSVTPLKSYASQRQAASAWKWVASVSFLLLALTGLHLWYQVHFQETLENTLWAERTVPKGQKVNLTLSDGTYVKLNAGSTLKFPKVFSEETREVFLEGEGYFEVSKDSLHPFVIRTGNLSTRVLGTSFIVRAYPQAPIIEVAVQSGQVQVEEKRQSQMVLTPQERVVYSKEDGKLDKSGFNPLKYFGWKDGIIYFEEATLLEIFEQLEQWYGVSFEINAIISDQETYKGSFQHESLRNVLSAIQYKVNFQFKISTDKVIVY
ncbi:FecR domain-containing protein [Rapidithrix thailandica]|uniref:FecR domain-containing protein n=1 Tax=Rapidithrix thailandica TaxID=413964 RepID=A0AAW9S9Q9_9BACT